MKSDETPIPSKNQGGESLSFDPEFKGPVRNRSCTDIICLFLFVSFIAGWFVVAFFAFKQGDPKTLIYPSDSEGNICGVGNFEDKPFLFFFDLMKCASPKVIKSGCPTPQICVEACPNDTFFADPRLPQSFKSKLICQYHVDIEEKTLVELGDGVSCAKWYLPSTPFKIPKFGEDLPHGANVLLRRCIPDKFMVQPPENTVVDHNSNATIKSDDGLQVNSEKMDKAMKYLAMFLSITETGEKIFSDFKTSWHWILMFLVISMLVSLLWIVMMRWVAGIMVWISILLVLVFCAAGCYFSVTKYVSLKNIPGSNSTLTFSTNLTSYMDKRDTWLALAILTGALFLVLFLVLLFLRKRIFIAIALIKEGSRAVSCMMTSLLFPIFPYFLQLIVCSYAIGVALYIASSGKASFTIANAPDGSDFKNGTSCDPKKFNTTGTGAKCMFQDFGMKDNIFSAHAYNFLGLFWGCFFAIGLGQVTLAGCFAAYYWTFNKSKDLPQFGVLIGFYRCLRFHLGSVAFGSLLIAIVRLIRVFLEYVDQKCKKYDNAVTKAIMCCMKCCFWVLEKILRFITKNAYIMVAVYGENFCLSGKRAVKLLWRNVVRTVIIDKVTDFLLFMGKLVVVGISAGSSFYFFTSNDERLGKYTAEIHFNLIPPLFITFGSYIIASGFFSVYGMAVDTLFLCFLEDCERNDGSKEKPYFMNKELMCILDKKNKFKTPSE